jgi:NADH dehydrogenase [ubiquinone] 1 alpha subcomplex assembly factor 1
MIVTRMISLVALLLMQAVAEQTLRPLFDFAGPEAAQQWQAVNDGVMGGVSDGRFKITDGKTLEFFGTLSLENNGGFASVRTRPGELGLSDGDDLVVRVKGDGREYVLNLYTKSRRTAFSYRAPLPTTKDEWTVVAIPLEDFIPTSFGRQVQGMGPVEPEQITSIGFMLSDKKPGKFRLNVGWVKVRPVDESDAVAGRNR